MPMNRHERRQSGEDGRERHDDILACLHRPPEASADKAILGVASSTWTRVTAAP